MRSSHSARSSKPSGFKAQVTLWAAVVGFVLSTLNGLFTIYDQVVQKPAEESSKAYADFEQDLQQITTIAQNVQNAIGQKGSGDPSVLSLEMVAQAQQQSLLANAMRLVPRVRTQLNSVDYGMLASAKFSAYDFGTAETYANEAVATARGNYFLAEALRLRGKVIAAAHSGDGIKQARKDFEQALHLTQAPSFAGERVTILGDWASAEGFTRNCSQMKLMAARWYRALADTAIPDSSRAALFQTGTNWFKDQKYCPWNESDRMMLPIASEPNPATR